MLSLAARLDKFSDADVPHVWGTVRSRVVSPTSRSIPGKYNGTTRAKSFGLYAGEIYSHNNRPAYRRLPVPVLRAHNRNQTTVSLRYCLHDIARLVYTVRHEVRSWKASSYLLASSRLRRGLVALISHVTGFHPFNHPQIAAIPCALRMCLPPFSHRHEHHMHYTSNADAIAVPCETLYIQPWLGHPETVRPY